MKSPYHIPEGHSSADYLMVFSRARSIKKLEQMKNEANEKLKEMANAKEFSEGEIVRISLEIEIAADDRYSQLELRKAD